jgi:anti-sigma factor RsiW
MKQLSDLPARDLELLSAYVDGGLSARQAEKLTRRLQREPELRWALEELRRTVSIVGSLPEVRPPRSFMLKPERAGTQSRPVAYPALQLATALATLAFVAVVGLDALTSIGRAAMVAPSEAPQAERFAAQQAEEPASVAPTEGPPAAGTSQPEQPLQPLIQAPAGTQAEGLGGGEPAVGFPGASEALPTVQAEDRALGPSPTPCVGCGGGGEGAPQVGALPSNLQETPQAGTTPEALSTEPSRGKAAVTQVAGNLANAPPPQPSGPYRSRVPLLRLSEISLALAAAILAGLTLWVRQRA